MLYQALEPVDFSQCLCVCQTDDGGSGCWVYLQWMASNTQLAGATPLGVAEENEATPKGVSGYVSFIVVMGGPYPNSLCSWAMRHAGVFGKAVGSVRTSKLPPLYQAELRTASLLGLLLPLFCLHPPRV